MPTLRFVILHHKLPDGEHWDLMLEQGDALATWRLPVPPTSPEVMPLSATRIGNHRKLYLDHQGPVSGDRGEVTRFDRGHYRFIHCDQTRWLIDLTGTVLTGRFELARQADQPADQWVLKPQVSPTG